VTSAIYRNILQGKIASKDGQKALQQFLALDIRAVYLPELHRTASALAKQFKRPNTYDAHYLALADHLACPLWTADERLYNTVKEKFTLIRWVEEKKEA
jgi:predicted nucleic acid-binding protein